MTITERIDSWQVAREEDGGEEAGIIDVHSGAEETAVDGSAYREW